MLYALLAGCGPLRIGEALGLEISKISGDFRTLTVNQKAKAGEIQLYLKTKNGMREIDLCTSLANMLREFVGKRTSGLVFHSKTGNQLLQSNILRRNFHPVLAELEHVKGGFNIFRRFRITQLETSDCPAALKHFWSGHAQAHGSERYVKLLNDRDYRLEWADRVGTGLRFQLANLAYCDWFVSRRKSLKTWWTRPGSNRRPHRCERCALPAELLAHE